MQAVHDLEHALNLVHRRLRRKLPSDFSETIRWGLSTEQMLPVGYKKASENQILDDDAIRDIVAAAAAYDGDGDDVIEALRPVMYGRRYDEPLPCRWRMKQVRKQESRGLIWVRDYRGPWTSAAEITRQWLAICESVATLATHLRI